MTLTRRESWSHWDTATSWCGGQSEPCELGDLLNRQGTDARVVSDRSANEHERVGLSLKRWADSVRRKTTIHLDINVERRVSWVSLDARKVDVTSL